jgi:hypothetical protein
MAILMIRYNHHKNTGLVLDWGLHSQSLWAESISSKQRVITVGFISHVEPHTTGWMAERSG